MSGMPFITTKYFITRNLKSFTSVQVVNSAEWMKNARGIVERKREKANKLKED
jgi:hypothetical protein